LRLPLGTNGAEQNRQLRYLPAQYLSLGSQLNMLFANPFFGVITILGATSTILITSAREDILGVDDRKQIIRLLSALLGVSSVAHQGPLGAKPGRAISPSDRTSNHFANAVASFVGFC
jgi:hypothetical protein